jgi:UDP-glucuronate 4-epimerase
MKKKEVILITGCAGFIGYNVAIKFLRKNYNIVGIDNLNSYYDVDLKRKRLSLLKEKFKNFNFFRTDIYNKKKLNKIFQKKRPFAVIHLAAQAGVRYSITKPEKYMRSNLVGFFNILELVKIYRIKELFFASSSSVYGDSKENILSENLNTDKPIQFYAATKKSNEIMAYCYSSLYKLNITALRFFTVYGPWGRPDMAYFKFVRSILNNKMIKVFNYGNHKRSFTYIDDISNAIYLLFTKKKIIKKKQESRFQIINLGNNKSITLMKFIKVIEKILNKKAKISFLPKQKGDVFATKADVKKIKKFFPQFPQFSLDYGLKKFIIWYKSYYKK